MAICSAIEDRLLIAILSRFCCFYVQLNFYLVPITALVFRESKQYLNIRLNSL